MEVAARARLASDLPVLADALVACHEKWAYPVEGTADPGAWLEPQSLTHAVTGTLDDVPVANVCLQALAPNSLTVSRFFVHPQAGGHGVGKAALEASMEWASTRCDVVTLDVLDKDQVAIALYKKLGWRCTGEGTHTARGTAYRVFYYEWTPPTA